MARRFRLVCKQILGCFVEGIVALGIAIDVPPCRPPAAAAQSIRDLCERGALIHPVQRRCGSAEVEASSFELGVFERRVHDGQAGQAREFAGQEIGKARVGFDGEDFCRPARGELCGGKARSGADLEQARSGTKSAAALQRVEDPVRIGRPRRVVVRGVLAKGAAAFLGAEVAQVHAYKLANAKVVELVMRRPGGNILCPILTQRPRHDRYPAAGTF